MNMRLYHLTDSETAEEIMRSGFRPGEDGLVWFGDNPSQIWGESARTVLLEVQIGKDACRQYQQAVEEEEWDTKAKRWVKPNHVEGLTYFAFPPKMLRGLSPRTLSLEERWVLMG